MTPLEARFRIPGGSLDLDDEEEVAQQSSSAQSDPPIPSPPPVQVTISHLNATQLSHVLSSIPHPLAPRTAEYALALNISGNAFRTLDKDALAILANHDTAMTEELARVKEGVFPLAIQIDEEATVPTNDVPSSSPSFGASTAEDLPPLSSNTQESSSDASAGGGTDVDRDTIQQESQESDAFAHPDDAPSHPSDEETNLPPSASAPVPPLSQPIPDAAATHPDVPPTSTAESTARTASSSDDLDSSEDGTDGALVQSEPGNAPSADADAASLLAVDDKAATLDTASSENTLHSDGAATTPSNLPSGKTTESTSSTLPAQDNNSLSADDRNSTGPSGSQPSTASDGDSSPHPPPPAPENTDAPTKTASGDVVGEGGPTSPEPCGASASGSDDDSTMAAGADVPLGEDKTAESQHRADSQSASTSGEDSASPPPVPAGGATSTGEGGTTSQTDAESASTSSGDAGADSSRASAEKDTTADEDEVAGHSLAEEDSAATSSSSASPPQNTGTSSETAGGPTLTTQGGITGQADSEPASASVGGGDDSAKADEDTAGKDGTTVTQINAESMGTSGAVEYATSPSPLPTPPATSTAADAETLIAGGSPTRADVGPEDSATSLTGSAGDEGTRTGTECEPISATQGATSTPSTPCTPQNMEGASAAHTDDVAIPSSRETSGKAEDGPKSSEDAEAPAPLAFDTSSDAQGGMDAAGEQSRTVNSSGDEDKATASSMDTKASSGSSTAAPTSSFDNANAVSGDSSENAATSSAALDRSDTNVIGSSAGNSGTSPSSNGGTRSEAATDGDERGSSSEQPPSGPRTDPVERATPPTPSPSIPISTPSASLCSTSGTPSAPPTVSSPDNRDGSFLDFNLLQFSPFLQSGAELPRDDTVLFKDPGRVLGPHPSFGTAEIKSRVDDTSADSPSNSSARSFDGTLTAGLGAREAEGPGKPSSQNGHDQPNRHFAKSDCTRSAADEEGTLSGSVAGPHDRSCDDTETPLGTDERARAADAPDDAHDDEDKLRPVHPPQLKLYIPISPTGLQDELSLLSPLFSSIESSTTVDCSERRDSSVATSAVERALSEASFSASRPFRRAPVKLRRGRRLPAGPLAGSEASLISNEPIRVYADAGVQTDEDAVEEHLRRRVKALERELRSLRAAMRRSEEHVVRESKPRSFLKKLAATERIVPTREPVFGLFKDMAFKFSTGTESSS